MDVAPTGFSQWFMTVLYLSDVLDFLSSDVVSSLENPTYFNAMEASACNASQFFALEIWYRLL